MEYERAEQVMDKWVNFLSEYISDYPDDYSIAMCDELHEAYNKIKNG